MIRKKMIVLALLCVLLIVALAIVSAHGFSLAEPIMPPIGPP